MPFSMLGNVESCAYPIPKMIEETTNAAWSPGHSMLHEKNRRAWTYYNNHVLLISKFLLSAHAHKHCAACAQNLTVATCMINPRNQ